nr:phosphoinositide 3-kinase regulatory subunit 4 isoform X1 [Onthophagus taurus]
MGNQLVGIAPSQIFPVEHYLAEHSDYKFDSSLGSTRFLKVARAKSPEGFVVVKVFAIHDPTLPLQPYRECLEQIRSKLTTAINCLPFQKIELLDKAGFLTREYVKFSLYDRISTRPFLTNLEKRWITFQVLYALNQCHKVGVCHGDIKLENITITSWNWLRLVDFAPFKPTFLPEDNPADYTYFFDTSRRRVCYIAPERFKKLVTLDSTSLFNENICSSDDLKPSMDIFSAGCALLELWNEGHSPFEYSQLLAYRNNEYSPQRHLDKIDDPYLKSLLTSMIQKDPTQRLSAESYLSQERGRLFPHYFYTFLQPYMLDFSASPILSCDEKMARIKKEVSSVVNLFSSKRSDCDLSNEMIIDVDDHANRADGLVIIISLVTSCVRGLHDCSAKLQCLDVMLELAKHANEETILDRLLPYMMHLTHDSNPRVKVVAIRTITTCLDFVKDVPRSDANVFPDYILPGLAPLATDRNVCVRTEFAKHIGQLAHIALQYLHQTVVDCNDKSSRTNSPKINYDAELQALHEMIKQMVGPLLSDTSPLVKRTLVNHNVAKLCMFFGHQMSNDILLSHMITFLNDKDDKELRATFFDAIVGIAACLGWHSTAVLKPLFVQGMRDVSEFVIVKTLKCMEHLTEVALFPKEMMVGLVMECSLFLVHPSLWIRQSAANFITKLTQTMNNLDVAVKIMPLLTESQKYELIEITHPHRLLASLKDPIPRPIYDSVLRCADFENFITTLNRRKEIRDMIKQDKVPGHQMLSEATAATKTLIRRLEEYGLNEFIEDRLIKYKQKILRYGKHKKHIDDNLMEGKIIILTVPNAGHVLNLESRVTQKLPYSSSDNSTRQSDGSISAVQGKANSRSSSPTHTTEPSSNFSVHERSYVQYRTSDCSTELRRLLLRQQDKYSEALRCREWAINTAWETPIPPPGWKLKGSLIAHLHEHKGAVKKLVHIPDSSLFASASKDGFVRVWDCAKIEGKNIANRSRQCYRFPGNPKLTGLAVCGNKGTMAASSVDGSVLVLQIDSGSSRLSLSEVRHLDRKRDVKALELQYWDSGPQSVLVYSTLFGSLVGWDLRSPREAWRLENGIKRGYPTSFCVNSHQSWVTVATDFGYHITWDLRFQLPVSTIKHPSGARVRKVLCHPKRDSWIIASYQSNNEITMWNVETGAREKVLWTSAAPPLSVNNMKDEGIWTMYTGLIDRNGFLLAGGHDGRVRYFDLEDPPNSRIAIHKAIDPLMGCTVKYHERLIDGIPVVVETLPSILDDKKNAGKADEVPRAGPEPPPMGHINSITDITICKASQCFMVTGSIDGVIKVWK